MRKHMSAKVSYEDRVMSLMFQAGNHAALTVGELAEHWQVTVQRVHQVLDAADETGFFRLGLVKLPSGQWGTSVYLTDTGQRELNNNYTACANADLLCINVAYIREREGERNV